MDRARRQLKVILVASMALLGLTFSPVAVPAAAAPVDVMFVFDTTGSMGSTLASAKAQASAIMSDLRSRLGGDVHFGVAETRDYPDLYGEPGDEPWTLIRGITADTTQVQGGIDALFATGGGDGPESYGRALWEADRDPSVGWRAGAKRLVVLIADNVPHDDDLNASLPAELRLGEVWNTGQDPGPDGVVGTADDLDWDRVVLPTLSANGLRIAMVLVQDPSFIEHWRVWARATGGDAVDGTAGEFSGAVVGIVESVSRLPDPPCPDGQARNAAGRCVPTTAVVFVSGLASHQRFADPGSISLCPDGGTWQRTAADAMTFPRMAGRYQVFLAPLDKGGALSSDCPGVAVSTAEAMHLDSKLYSNHDTNGARLTTFLAFLARNYGIRDVYLVGHSYGGIWSRAALTQLTRTSSPPVRIAGIVTVGTPHTGSWAADLADSLRLACILETGRLLKPSCLARDAVKIAFGEAVRGLTADVMRSWNPSQRNQAPWGCVPVGTIAGDFFKLGPIGFSGSYYFPQDGAVGLSSAHAYGASIANVRSIGQHDTVHSAVNLPGYPNDRVMTTDGRVRDTIINFVTRPPLIGPNCSAPISFERADAKTLVAATEAAQATPTRRRPRVQRVPFIEAPITLGPGGRVPALEAGRTLVLVNRASAFCGSRRLEMLPVLGLPDVQVAAGPPCRRSALTIRGAQRRSGATIIVKAKAGLAVSSPRAGRLRLAQYGVAPRSRATVQVQNLTGRVVARFTLRGRNAITRKLSPGRYTVTVTQRTPRRALATQVRT